MKDHCGMGGQPAARFDASGITETIKRALASAGLDPHAGTMKGVTNIIEQALSTAGLIQRRDMPDGRGVTIDSTARAIRAEPENPVAIQHQPMARDEIVVEPRTSDISARRRGEFLERSFAGVNGARMYKVYVPAQYSIASTERVPMVVMLHGCTQSPDDFATGTRMNALADEYGFIVVYPAQSANANVQKCWNWFRTQDQVRESGEPAIIAGITRDVASTYRIDERRIFVAGMSAGAAMAVILGATYPDLYAAVGAHSGLAYGAAHDMPSAYGAMRGGSGLSRAASQAAIAIPTIVFHGDGDHTVDARNATTIVEQTTAKHDHATLRVDARTGTAPGGRTYSRTDYLDASDRVVAEQWTLHGAGHTWSGGSAAGSFTDPRGPDASREMIRFFFSLARSGTA